MRRNAKRVIPYVFSALCVAYVLWDIDYSNLMDSFNTLRLEPFIVSQTLLLLTFLPVSARLHFLASEKTTLTTCIHASFVCAASNTLLPARLGEAAKVLILNTEDKLPLKETLVIVFWERFADLNAILLLGLFAALQFHFSLAILPLLIIVMGLWTILTFLSLWPQHVKQLLSYIPWEGIRGFCHDLALVLTSKLRLKDMGPLSMYTLLIWLMGFSSFFLALHFGTSLGLTFDHILLVFIASIFGISIPSAPAGIGVYESFVTGALLYNGVPKEQALAIAIVLHLMQMLLPTLIGMCFFPHLTGSSLDFFRRLKNNI